jgi:hypothetical protein
MKRLQNSVKDYITVKEEKKRMVLYTFLFLKVSLVFPSKKAYNKNAVNIY